MTTTPPAARRVGDRPPARIRLVGQLVARTVARAPWLWPVLRRPVTRFFDRVAPHWDARVRPDSPEHLAALAAALERLDAAPARILDLGTGTGAAARHLAQCYPEAEVVGVDISEAMVEAARAKVGDELRPRLRFDAADAAALPYEPRGFDLVVQVSVPVFFDAVAGMVRPGGHVIVVSSIGAATPFYTPIATLRRGFERRGLHEVASGPAGNGEFFIASA